MIPGIEQRFVVAADGTRIGYQHRAGRTDDAPVLVLANGLGGTYLAFQHVYRAVPDHRVICWDYRGLYTSSVPSNERANQINDQVSDLIAIVTAERVDRFALAGWSMGVQVSLETYRQHTGRIEGLMLINGTFGKPFATVMGSQMVGKTIPHMLSLIKAQAAMAGAITKRVAGTKLLVKLMQRFGMVADTVDIDIFSEVAAGFASIEWGYYSDLLRRLDEHDARDVLPTVAVPTAIITGDRDTLTPPSKAREMASAIPQAELTLIRGGTHYTPIEYPAEVRAAVRKWLARMPGHGVVT